MVGNSPKNLQDALRCASLGQIVQMQFTNQVVSFTRSQENPTLFNVDLQYKNNNGEIICVKVGNFEQYSDVNRFITNFQNFCRNRYGISGEFHTVQVTEDKENNEVMSLCWAENCSIWEEVKFVITSAIKER